MTTEQPQRRKRGPGKQPSKAMVMFTMRLPVSVIDYYKQKYPSYTVGMREVLVAEMSRAIHDDET